MPSPSEHTSSPTSATPPRFDRLDALRGLAMVWMTVFHFCFDLSYLQLWPQDFYNNPWWLWQRTAIVSLFLLCAGLGQAVASSQQVPLARFLQRWSRVAACAALVSLGSYFVFPQSFIYFGVLHGMAVMLLMLRLVGRQRLAYLATFALACLVLPVLYRHYSQDLPAQWVGLLNHKAFSVLGLVTAKPITEDYVPLLPWFGVMLLGYVGGLHLLRNPISQLGRHLRQPARQPVAKALAWLGRHSLPYYMLHQLVLLGTLSLLAHWLR